MKKLITLVLSFLLINGFISAQNNESADKKIDKYLEEISKYEYGKNDEVLSKINELVKAEILINNKLRIIEEKILAALAGNISKDAKIFLGKKLSLFASEQTYELLSEMLLDEETSDIARYVIDRIKNNSATEILLEALESENINIRLGIINSLGRRTDESSIETLGDLVLSKNKIVADAAATALGKAANSIALKIIEAALEEKIVSKEKLADSYLLCADKLAASGNKSRANEIYKKILNGDFDKKLKGAAIKGLALNDVDKLDELLIKYLKCDEKYLRSVAGGLVKTLKNKNGILTVAKSLNNLAPLQKVQVITSFKEMKAVSTVPFIKKECGSENEVVRIAAYNGLKKLGAESEVLFLAEKASVEKGDVKKAAQESLDFISKGEIDKKILSLIDDAEASVKIELIRAVGSRRISNSFEKIVNTAKDENNRVRAESYKTLSIITKPNKLNVLIDLFYDVSGNGDIKRLETTLAKVAVKIADVNKRADVFIDGIKKLNDDQKKLSFIRILGSTGDLKAFNLLKENLQSADDEIVKASIQAFINWPNNDLLDDLLTKAKSADNETHKILALRAYISLVKNNAVENDTNIPLLYKKAVELSSDANEMRMIISGLAENKTTESLSMISEFLKNSELRSEAEIAALNVIQAIWWGNREESKRICESIIKESSNKARVKIAKGILSSIKEVN